MPMPTEGPWPPKRLAPAYTAYNEWDAWLSGLPARLIDVYGTYTNSLPPSQRTRPGQYAGGLVGAVSRFLWGNPVRPGERDGRLHVPLAADLTSTASALLFSEPPTIVVESNVPAQDRLDGMVDAGLWSTLRHAAEAASAFGDVYLRPVVDREVSPDRAILAPVHADGAIPVLRWGHLAEVTFWTELERDGSTVIRLLEHHAPGRITYALHAGNATELGRLLSLADHPDAAALADVVDADGGQDTGIKELDVVRVPNSGPQRRWRKQGQIRYLGRSDFDGNEPIFDAIDSTWTSWMRDLRLARGRVHVPAYMLDNFGPGQGAAWDPEREVYSALNATPSTAGTGSGLTVSQFAIRVTEHKATLDALQEVAYRHAGLSGQTMGDEGDVAMTATEAIARERLSYITRGDRVQTWRAALGRYLQIHLAMEAAAKIPGAVLLKDAPAVEFPDAVSESPETTARTVQLLRQAEAISVETAVRMVHPEWDDDQVADEVARIDQDKGAGLPGNSDPFEAGNAFAAAPLPGLPIAEPGAAPGAEPQE